MGTKLKLIGQLDYDLIWSTCAVMGKDKIFLCFNMNNNEDDKRCRTALNPLDKITEIQQSTHPHRDASIAASVCKYRERKDPQRSF